MLYSNTLKPYKQLITTSPELTPSVRLPVVVLPTERGVVKISALLLSEITRSCRAGLQTTVKLNVNTKDQAYRMSYPSSH